LKFRFYSLLLLPALLFVAGCTTAPMLHPRPVAIPPGIAPMQVQHAIRRALIGRGWIIIGHRPGSYTAKLIGNSWSARIRVGYTVHDIRLYYLGSRGLDYHKTHVTTHKPPASPNWYDWNRKSAQRKGVQRKSVAIINRHWNNWVVALTHDLRTNLAVLAYGNGNTNR